jgi:hypothetical protein
MPFQLGLPAALRRFGLTVELVPGWETRGSSTFSPRGAVAHWTAGPRGTTKRPSLNIVVNGRPGLPGPLANVYLDRNGIAVVCAAGRANHAGVGGWRGLTANSQVFGTEAECGGDGDWTPAQRRAYPLVNAAYCSLGGFDHSMVCGHSEWAPTRKIDIRDWPMNLMRAQVAALLASPPGEDDMPTAKEVADAVLAAKVSDETGNVRQTLQDARQIARRAEEAADEAKAEAAAIRGEIAALRAQLQEGPAS